MGTNCSLHNRGIKSINNSINQSINPSCIDISGSCKTAGQFSEQAVDDFGLIAWQQGQLRSRIFEMKQLSWKQEGSHLNKTMPPHDVSRVVETSHHGDQKVNHKE